MMVDEAMKKKRKKKDNSLGEFWGPLYTMQCLSVLSAFLQSGGAVLRGKKEDGTKDIIMSAAVKKCAVIRSKLLAVDTLCRKYVVVEEFKPSRYIFVLP